MKTLKCAFAGLRLVPFGASAMARLLPATKRNHRTVRARGPDRCVRARRLGFETIADTVAHSAARLKAQPPNGRR